MYGTWIKVELIFAMRQYTEAQLKSFGVWDFDLLATHSLEAQEKELQFRHLKQMNANMG